ncbi:MAG TPA: hypothetical protein VGC79_19900, partial [Polyangiaceae bacterium]
LLGPGSGGSANGDAGESTCVVAQWDCSQAAPSCIRDLSQSSPNINCFCNRNRPRDANDCAANETLFCQQGYAPQLEPSTHTWDYSIHVQCSCVATPPANDQEAATASCLQLFPGETKSTMAAYLPVTQTCDGTVCSATSADVLRQEGIMCGCADIGLK